MNDELEQLKHALTLMTAGREQDQRDLGVCIEALSDIAHRYKHSSYDAGDKAIAALVKIGVWREGEE